MEYEVRFDGGTNVLLSSLSPDVFETIAAADPEASWWGVYQAPGGNPERLYAVIKAAAESADLDPPPVPQTMAEAEKLVDMIAIVAMDDRPKVGTVKASPSTSEADVLETTS